MRVCEEVRERVLWREEGVKNGQRERGDYVCSFERDLLVLQVDLRI